MFLARGVLTRRQECTTGITPSAGLCSWVFGPDDSLGVYLRSGSNRNKKVPFGGSGVLLHVRAAGLPYNLRCTESCKNVRGDVF
jgi:hypothetical protein